MICYTILREKIMGEKKQKTPKGYEIPVPTKEEFERNLKKVAKPNKSAPPNPKK